MTSIEPVGFSLIPPPSWLRVTNRIADIFGSGLDALLPERLMTDAGAIAGLPPEFPAHVYDALQVLYESMRAETKMHYLGRANMQTMLVTGLACMLRIEKMFADDPSLAREPLLSPVVVVGVPRSGTTFLHRLLSSAPDATGILMREHFTPVDLDAFGYSPRAIQVKFQPWLSASKVYDIDAIHYVRLDLPDECNLGMRLAGRSMIYWATTPTHSYLRWLLQQDMRESYQLYRKVLILRQRAHPGKRLTLKCPHHLAWLPAFTEAVPEAIFVQTHRNPAEVVPSECKLILSLHGVSVHELDWRRSVESNHFKVRTYADRAVEFADTPAGQRVHHVDYRRLVKEPVRVAREIHERMGLAVSAAHEATWKEFATENRQHKHGKNAYSMAQFGLNEASINREFAAYRDRFLGT
ncbi:MAG TPA: sulfotransferase [Polyangium sp.]|nr:sulfotransferase [Polyangium sp.]